MKPPVEIKSPPTRNLSRRILELNAALTSELDLERLLEKIMDALIEITGAERGFILLSKGNVLQKVFSKNYEASKMEPLEDRISMSLAKKVFTENQPVITVDALTDRRFTHTASIHQLKLRSIICLPFSFGEKVLGVIYLDSRLKKAFFETDQYEELAPFIHQVAIAVNNARIFEEKDKTISHLTSELKTTREEIALKYSYANLVGRHPKMIRLFHLVDKVTDAMVPVVIQGESGVGKEMIAKSIHYNGKRAQGSFVSINCAALPENLLEAELFGSVKGAYTGATEDRPGLFELAHRGTLFLDEIGDMPLAMQTKLLRVIQEGEVRPLGAKQTRKVDVRVISASHQDLKELVRHKKFREDLFYRLFVAIITIPPLRERREDIPYLVEHFLKVYAEKNALPKKKISREALKVLVDYTWPGNVRELENLIYQVSVFTEASTIEVADLRIKEELFGGGKEDSANLFSEQIDGGHLSLSEAKQEFEKKEIKRVLEMYHGHITKAANHLKMVRPQLSRLIKTHGLKSLIVVSICYLIF